MWLLWIFSLAASFLLPATGEVVQSFSQCHQFFLNGTPPNVVPEKPARICQKYNNKYHFATMYDKSRRIPIFSAYKYESGSGRRPTVWMIEPQLAQHTAQASMEPESSCGIKRLLLQKSQAVSSDYQNAMPYNRGHLAPVCHQPNQESKNATFTLTNIVPQFEKLNGGKWKQYEQDVQTYANQCLETYIIVGAVPGKGNLKNRVNIPSHTWAAVCCLTKKQTKEFRGVIAENNQDNITKINNLRQLEEQLQNQYGQTIDLFNGACY